MSETIIRYLYVRFVRPFFPHHLHRQRVRTLWFSLSYFGVFGFKNLSFAEKLLLLKRFLTVDWNLIHGHRPGEIVTICRALSERRARNGEVMIEAGCFNGGSAAKFSTICKMLGYSLRVYDSFEGVEPLAEEEKKGSYDFTGEYAAAEEVVRSNINRYGEINVCTFHKGWFADTLAARPVDAPVRVAYIDCDVAKGTREALTGIIPVLVKGSYVFSQDFHIDVVREMLQSPATWVALKQPMPKITYENGFLASLRF